MNTTIRLSVTLDRLTRWLARAAVVALLLPGCLAAPASEAEIAAELAESDRIQENTDPGFCYYNVAGQRDDDCPSEKGE